MDRDRFMTPEAAKDFGLIDEVIANRPEGEDGGDSKSKKKDD